MTDEQALEEIDRRISVVRDNLRNLVEQASGFSGAADEARTADRIAEQEGLLAELLKEKSDLVK